MCWKATMDSEYQSLMMINKTWVLVKCPKDWPIVSSKWFFKRKYNADGTISRFKARSVTQGFYSNRRY